ncbi:MAG: hypothetical protein ACFCVC_16390 [Acidimicrobiia bacterium]
MRFEVVPQELEGAQSLFQELSGHLAELIELGRGLEGAIPSAGPTVLVHAMGGLNSAWLRVGEQVMDDLVALARRLTEASVTYVVTDQAAVGR